MQPNQQNTDIFATVNQTAIRKTFTTDSLTINDNDSTIKDNTNDITPLKNIPTKTSHNLNNDLRNTPILKEVNLDNKQDNSARARIKKSQITLA